MSKTICINAQYYYTGTDGCQHYKGRRTILKDDIHLIGNLKHFKMLPPLHYINVLSIDDDHNSIISVGGYGRCGMFTMEYGV